MNLSHVDDSGAARMVDVTDKAVTVRTAVAAGVFVTTAAVIAAVRDNAVAKGDVLATARIAGIMGVKRTPDLVPLCHPLPITGVEVDLAMGDGHAAGDAAATITITATVRSAGRTGVEMEALTAVAVAGLTLHDMVKAMDPAATLTDIRVLTKAGGKTGTWSRDD